MAGQDEVLPATQFRDVSIFTIIYNTKLSEPSASQVEAALLARTCHIKLQSNYDLVLDLTSTFLVKFVYSGMAKQISFF